MDGFSNGWMGGRNKYGRLDEWMDGIICGLIVGHVDVEGWVIGWINVWVDDVWRCGLISG